MRTRLAMLGLAVLAAPAAAEPPLWSMDRDASALTFTGRQNGNEVTGSFEEFTAEIRFDPDDLTAAMVRVEVAIASIQLATSQQEEIVGGSAWFDTAAFPAAVFEATGFEPAGEGYRATGTLTLKGVEREVPLAFAIDVQGDRAVASGTGEVLRTAFGIGPEGALLGVEVAPEVEVQFQITAERAG